MGNQNECSVHESMEVEEGERPTIETVCVWVQQVRLVLWDQAIEGFVSGGRKTSSV